MNTRKVFLFEEFSAGEVSKPNQQVTPATQTTATDVAVDKKAAGAEIRAEIIKDVDTILNNLETLSTRIQESITELTNDVESGVELNQEILEALESLVSINEGELNEEGASKKVMDLIWYAPKARKAMKKVNKVRNNQVAIELAKDQLPKGDPKKQKLTDKAAGAKTKADELEKAVRDKFSDRGNYVQKTISTEDIKGKLERIKKETGMSNDPDTKKDLQSQYADMSRKLDQEQEALKDLASEAPKKQVKRAKDDIEQNDGQKPAEAKPTAQASQGSPSGAGPNESEIRDGSGRTNVEKINLDSLQESKEKQEPIIYEGMRISDKFRALMNR